MTLTSEEKQVWSDFPAERSAIPVLLYHGIGAESDFSNAADAYYGVDADDFARQMTEIHHAGYETIDLQTFVDFVGKSGSTCPRGRCCSRSTMRGPTRGPAATPSSRSWGSPRSCSSTSVASTPATAST